jgi:hypothetical protein
MPKKAGQGRSKVQQSKARTSKRFELVHSYVPPIEEIQQESREIEVEAPAPVAVALAPTDAPQSAGATDRKASSVGKRAARRTGQRQRENIPRYRRHDVLITSEEFAYVKNDLKLIAALTALMIAIIIVAGIVLS